LFVGAGECLSDEENVMTRKLLAAVFVAVLGIAGIAGPVLAATADCCAPGADCCNGGSCC